jgi:fructose-1,6-bisphosphatase-3
MPETAVKILKEFGLDPKTARIINGHVPVKVKQGRKSGEGQRPSHRHRRRLLARLPGQTGIAGYTLISNSYGLLLAAHWTPSAAA